MLDDHVQYRVSDGDADFLFFSVFGHEHLAHPDTVKVAFSGENGAPEFSVCEYAMGFDPIVFGDRYLRLPLFALSKPYSRLRSREPVSLEEVHGRR